MIHKRLSATESKVIVTFEIPGSAWADSIYLVGDLNGWDRKTLPLQPGRQGNWQREVELDEEREVRFRYLVNGETWWSEGQPDRHVVWSDGIYDSIVIAQLPQAT